MSAPRPKKKKRATAEPSTSRDASKQHSRAALVKAAVELFAEQGLDLPSLDAICERAGFTRGAFYVHFRDREELLVAVMDTVGESFLASIFAAPSRTRASRASRGTQLHDLVVRFLDAVQEGRYPLMSGTGAPTIKPHQLLEACARSPVVRERYKKLVLASVEGVKGLVELDQVEGGIRSDLDAAMAARLALCTIVGAQTLGEIGVEIDALRLGAFLERLFSAPSSRSS